VYLVAAARVRDVLRIRHELGKSFLCLFLRGVGDVAEVSPARRRTSMRRFGVIAFGLTLVGLIAALPSHLVAYTGEKLAKGAKVSIEQARAIALQARAGAITDEELEREKGGSGLRYSFDIKSGHVVYEVGVDAQTGKVLENKKEGPHPD
jgi:hypothetical protein